LVRIDAVAALVAELRTILGGNARPPGISCIMVHHVGGRHIVTDRRSGRESSVLVRASRSEPDAGQPARGQG